MLKVYIAGPYTKGDVAVNVRNAIAAGVELLKAGHAPFIPHLSHFIHMHEPMPYGVWIEVDNAFLPHCDALVRIPGESLGADNEVEFAEAIQIPVFYSVAEFVALASTVREAARRG
jgi:hypothetical protein